jgi:hypothetical protein
MKMSRVFWLSLIVCALAGPLLAQEKPRPPAKAGPSSAQKQTALTVSTNADFPIIGYIEKRGRTITIKAGPKGPLYSVKNDEGKVLFEDLSAEQLRTQAPELHQFLKTAVANSSDKKHVVDASRGPVSSLR